MRYFDGKCSLCEKTIQICGYALGNDGFLCADCTRLAYQHPAILPEKRTFDAAIGYKANSKIAASVEALRDCFCEQCTEYHLPS
jgi:hypothetical protein